MTGAGPMAEPPSPRTPHPVQTGGVHVRKFEKERLDDCRFLPRGARRALPWIATLPLSGEALSTSGLIESVISDEY